MTVIHILNIRFWYWYWYWNKMLSYWPSKFYATQHVQTNWPCCTSRFFVYRRESNPYTDIHSNFLFIWMNEISNTFFVIFSFSMHSVLWLWWFIKINILISLYDDILPYQWNGLYWHVFRLFLDLCFQNSGLKSSMNSLIGKIDIPFRLCQCLSRHTYWISRICCSNTEKCEYAANANGKKESASGNFLRICSSN